MFEAFMKIFPRMAFTHFSITVILIHTACAIFTSQCQFDKRCRCNKVEADCSRKNLKTIPKIPNNVQIIDVSHNMICEIPDSHFQNNTQLYELSLAYNKLQNLTGVSFKGLENVINVKLQNNNIANIENTSFQFLKAVRFIDLKNNPVIVTDINFSLLPSLRTLRMDFVAKEGLPIVEGLARLQQLDISGLSGKCEILRITEETFKWLPNLKELVLSACKVNFIHRGAFKYMKNLETLDVSFNTCLKFKGLENIKHDLPFTSIKILKVNKIHKTFELNTALCTSHIEQLKATNLTELHIDSNRLQLIEKGALSKLPYTIERIFMSDNEFSYGDYIFDALFVPIQFANVSLLFYSHYPSHKGEQVCKPVHVNSCKVYRKNSIRHAIFQKGQTVQIPRRLKVLIYRQCRLQYEIPSFHLSDNSLEYIDGSQNIFYAWKGPLLTLEKTHTLNMSYNLCSNVSNVFFESTPNLQNLYIQNNLLGFALPDDVDGKILEHLPKLETIDLSQNRIPTLPFRFFNAQLFLKFLKLEGNMLDDINFQISHLKQLSTIDLRNNRFSSLDKNVLDQLEKLIKYNPKISLDISGNPLKCSCDTIDFIRWIWRNKNNFRNLKITNCKLKDESKHTLNEPERTYQTLLKHCSSYTTLIIGVTSSLILFIFTLISGLVYRHRWRLRYMYYMVRSKNQRKQKISVDQKSYVYDAFISYEDDDCSFVHQKLLKKLEAESNLKLCLHKRDFLPGNDIAANITSAIHNSRKTVAIMSHNYLDSYWCMFEYNMARVESVYSRNKDNILFLVFIEKMSPKDLPLIILELVQSQTYIEYPNDEYGDTVFWEKLREALL